MASDDTVLCGRVASGLKQTLSTPKWHKLDAFFFIWAAKENCLGCSDVLDLQLCLMHGSLHGNIDTGFAGISCQSGSIFPAAASTP